MGKVKSMRTLNPIDLGPKQCILEAFNSLFEREHNPNN